MEKLPENGGIKIARNGKNQDGPMGPPARVQVGFARVKVVLARVGVGTGQEKWPFFSTLWPKWGKFRAAEGRLTGFRRLLAPFCGFLWRTLSTIPFFQDAKTGSSSGNSNFVSCSSGAPYFSSSGAAVFFFRGFLASSCLAFRVFSIFWM